MSITFDGIEWNYTNLNGIGYDSDTLLEPYGRWFYLITDALNYEEEIINVTVSDSNINYPRYRHQDNLIKINDYSNRIINYSCAELSVSLTDDIARTATKAENESLTLIDNPIRQFERLDKEDVAYMLDECRYIQDLDGVISIVDQLELSGAISLFDVEAKDGIWSKSDFESWCEDNCPVNYNELRPFIPGEYEYKNAYVGFRLSKPPTNGRFGVVHSTVYIDVEDTVEKGDAEITSDEILGGATTKKVYFSKRFYTSPHIMTSLIYTTENCYIDVTEVSREYFVFGFKSISTQQYVAGKLSWLADGY